MAFMTRVILLALLVLVLHAQVSAKNYIRYHQRSLMVQEQIAAGEYGRALVELDRLERRFGLMPTETFALALCQKATGDTSAARRSYLKCLEQQGLLVWLYIKPPALQNNVDSNWYASVVNQAEAFRQTHPEFIDGPTGTVPTVLTRINTVHQNFLDSVQRLSDRTGSETGVAGSYDAIRRRYDAILDSLITGKAPSFTVEAYGVNTELQTFLLHVSPEFMIARRKHIYKWLKKGLIYPDDYAACVDGPSYRLQKPMIYKFYRSTNDPSVSDDYELNRWKIGMGTDRLNALRFLRPE